MIKIFGLIYTLIVSIGALFHQINETNKNKENKTKYIHPNGLTYIDHKGYSRLVSNDELVFYNNKNGDYVLENANGYVYKNFSEEKRIKKLEENTRTARENNETTYCIDDNEHKHDWFCKGKRFKDFETGKIYIIRCINYKYYYMDIDTGMVIRKTDWQIKEDERKKGDKFHFKDIDIEEFNKKQETIENKRMLYREFDYNCNCNLYK